MKKKLLIVSLVILCLIGTLYFRGYRSNQDEIYTTQLIAEEEKPKNTSATAEVGDLDVTSKKHANQMDLQQELFKVNQELSNLKSELAAIKSMLTQISSQKLTTSNPIIKLTSEEIQAKINAQRVRSQDESQKTFDLIDTSFRQQAIDDNWAKQSQLSIQNALSSSKMSGISSPSIDCRITMCRVEFSNANRSRHCFRRISIASWQSISRYAI